MSTVPHGGRAAVIVARGARAVEALLLAELAELAAAARREPALLARPVLVVVPSASLRLHLAARLVAEHGAAAGIAVVTLHRLAHEVVAAADAPERRGAALFPLLVRRAARREPALAGFLEPLADGYAGIAGTVRDLLDAGLEAAHADALDERLAELDRRGWDAALTRARAVVRVAAAVHEEMEALGAGRTSTLLRLAAELLLADAGRVLPARAVLVHGFAEATGVATDLIEALVRRCGARVFVDEPPDPAEPGRADLGAVFTHRLRGRLAGYAAEIDSRASGAPAPAAAADLVMRRAPGTFAELRAVAADVRALLDGGARPESIGVVARDLGAVQVALHQHFGRLGIPYSAHGAPGLRGPASRRLDALAALLAAGGDAPVDAWLDLAYGAEGARVGDLRLALRVLGAATVADVAGLQLEQRLGGAAWLALPVRRGFDPAEGSGDEDGAGDAGEADEAAGRRSLSPTRRRVPAARLQGAVDAAAHWRRAWAALPARGPMRVHAAGLRGLLDDVLRWRPDPGGGDTMHRALATLTAELPQTLELERDEALDLLREALRDGGRVPAGGAGGGVQVLGVVEARGRTFERLFVVGLNRDVFPRPVREDWLLPDRLRAALLPLLPDLPLKRTGHDEERYLFAQLLSAAPHVTVSWTECDDDGRPTPASPLVERLRAVAAGEPALLRDLWAPGGVGDRAPRPAHEHAVLAGLSGDRERLAAVLPIALAAAGPAPAPGTGEPCEPGAGTAAGAAGGAGTVPAPAAGDVARARAAVLAEIDPDRRTADGRRRATLPGPYFGFVGPAPGRGADTSAGPAPARGAETVTDPEHCAGDPRAADPWVTALEGIARCPWRMFLGSVLRLDPAPDADAGLPALSGALLGSTVHAALERIAGGAPGGGPQSLANLSVIAARPAAWPDEAGLEGILAAAAEEVLREEGLALPLLVRSFAERARPFLDAAHAADFAGETPPAVAGVEVEGAAVVTDAGGRERRVGFRVDRADAVAGALRLTDFKSGRPFSNAGTEAGKRKALLTAIAGGQWLQAAAYAAAGGEVAAGRYLFLRPEIADGARAFVAAAEPEVLQAFRLAALDLLALHDAGAFFPRVVGRDGKAENAACKACPFREACVAGDSGARRRLLAWAPVGGGAGDAAVRAAARVWRLGTDDDGGAGGEGSA